MQFISEAALVLTGYEPADFVSGAVNWEDIVHPEDRASVSSEVGQAVQHGARYDLNYRILRKSGEVRWVYERGSAKRDENENPVHLEGFIGDNHRQTVAEEQLRETEERYRLASRATRDLVWDWELACDRVVWNEAPEPRFGYCYEALGPSGEWWKTRLHPDDRASVDAALNQVLAGQGSHFLAEYRFRRCDGSYAEVLDRGYVIRDPAGRPMRFVGAMQDLSENKLALAALRESEAMSQSIMSASADCIKIVMLDGRIERLNEPGVCAMELESAGQVEGAVWADLWPPQSRASVIDAVAAASQGAAARFAGFCPTAKGAPRWWDVVVTPMFDETGRVSRLLAISRDVTIIRQTTEQLQWSSDHDALTHLPNRRAFEAHLQASTLEAMATGSSLGLLLIDLDHFKHINDTLGHQAGDFLLASFAERLQGAVRRNDFVARLGGDEFAVVLGNVEGDTDLLRAGASILKRIQAPVRYEGRILSTRASIGGALFPRDAGSAHELFKNADTALFALKGEGRGGTRMFHGQMREHLEMAATQISLARTAIDCDHIRPHYQSKVDLLTGRVVGLEALLRLRHRTKRLSLPSTIAEAFKDYELSSQIGQLMQHAVLRDAARWSADRVAFGRISINAAPAEFLRDDYAELLLQGLDRHQVSPHLIEVEVTEHVFTERGADYVSRALHKLHTAGVRIALDDFGTGYSSLSHLKDFPVDVVKIDRSFVEQMVEKAEIAAIVRAVANLCATLGIEVVAEGIETPEQVELLVRKGCNIGQGFLFSRPLPAAEIPALLSAQCGAATCASEHCSPSALARLPVGLPGR